MLKLYHSPGAVCAAKVRLVLAEKELAWDGVALDLSKGEQFAPEYLALNPNGVVPTLIDGAEVVTESTVINEYLDEAFPDLPLRPADASGRAQVRLWTKREDTVHAAINTMTNAIVFTPELRQKSREDQAARIDGIPDPLRRAKWWDIVAKGMESRNVTDAMVTFARQFAAMEKALERRPWLAGPAFTLADAGLLSFIVRLKHLKLDFMWTEHFPRVTAWVERCLARPSVEQGIGQYFNPAYVAHYAECGDAANAIARAKYAEAVRGR